MSKISSERRKKANAVLASVVNRVAKITEGSYVGQWDTAWQHTRETHDVFFQALIDWEKGEDTEADRDAVRRAADDYVAAWQEARVLYEEHKAGI